MSGSTNGGTPPSNGSLSHNPGWWRPLWKYSGPVIVSHLGGSSTTFPLWEATSAHVTGTHTSSATWCCGGCSTRTLAPNPDGRNPSGSSTMPSVNHRVSAPENVTTPR